jgi:hypothetical protein
LAINWSCGGRGELHQAVYFPVGVIKAETICRSSWAWLYLRRRTVEQASAENSGLITPVIDAQFRLADRGASTADP